MFDYIVIGSGIVGSFITRELSKYQVSVLVLDKENDIASHQTTANSAIIHSGHDPKENTLKARLCVEGNRMYHELEDTLAIPLLKTGAFVVAHNQEEEKDLVTLFERGFHNGVTDMQFIDGDQARILEPRLASSITQVLSLPTTMVTYPWEVAIHAIGNAIKNGATFKRNANVIAIKDLKTHYEVRLENNTVIETKNIINAAGVMSDIIASFIEESPFKITPRKGEYFVLDKKVKGLFKQVIYPLPTKAGKGVLIVPQVHGNILLGPTSTLVTDRLTADTSLTGMKSIKEQLKPLSTEIPYEYIIRNFAGIRASSDYEDFYIQESRLHKGFYHVAGIDSPGLTAAPAIAQYLVNEIIKIEAPLKSNFDPTYTKPIVFNELSLDEKLKMIHDNPKYGNLICKCEKITEQEIIDAITGSTGNDTVKGIKKRARAGSGLCQGGYCEGLVMKIISRETGIPLHEINYYHENTPILVKETKKP